VFTQLKTIETSKPLQTYEEVPECYNYNNFSHSNILMHPGVFSWRAFIAFNIFNTKLYLYDTINKDIFIYKEDFVPNTLFSRLKFLKQQTLSSDKTYATKINFLKNIFININFIEYFFWIIFLIKLFMPLGWIYIIKKK
jgi:hypothetical protein